MPQRLKALDSIRGIAALIVLLGHCYRFVLPENTIQPSNLLSEFLINLLTAGDAAVILFFVLSGFVLTLSLLNNKQTYKIFIIRRFFRIYPALFVSVIFSYLLHLIIGYNTTLNIASSYQNTFQPSEAVSILNLIGHLILTGIAAKHLFLDSVIWSLVYEMRISLIFPILVLLCIRYGCIKILSASILLSIASTYIVWSNSGLLVRGYTESTFFDSLIATAYFISFFIMGICLAINRDNLSNIIGKLMPITKIGILLVSLIFLAHNESLHPNIVDFIYAIGATAIISLAIGWQKFAKCLMNPPLLWLGRISYSLYLTHWIVIYIICELFGNSLSIWAIIAAIITFSLICAELMAKFIEYPCINLGKRLLNKGEVCHENK